MTSYEVLQLLADRASLGGLESEADMLRQLADAAGNMSIFEGWFSYNTMHNVASIITSALPAVQSLTTYTELLILCHRMCDAMENAKRQSVERN